MNLFINLNIYSDLKIVNQYLNLSIENYLRQMATGYSENAGPVVLRVAHIYGPLAMLFVGVVAASMALACEIMYHNYMNKTRH